MNMIKHLVISPQRMLTSKLSKKIVQSGTELRLSNLKRTNSSLLAALKKIILELFNHEYYFTLHSYILIELAIFEFSIILISFIFLFTF